MHRNRFALFSNRALFLSFAVGLSACGGKADTTPPAGAINDTGVTDCVASTQQIIDCAAADTQLEWYGQDANYGRDLRAQAGELSKVGAGQAGFDFSKMAASGALLSDQNHAWVEDGSEGDGDHWSCVKDHVTGLVWEVKSTDQAAIAHTDRTFNWYNPDPASHGGDAGAERGNSCGAGEVCNTAEYLASLNAQQLCGRNNWRLPTLTELLSIADQSQTNPPLDQNYFPNSSFNAHWTAQTVAADPSSAWYVYFTAAGNGSISKAAQAHIRAVSSDDLR